jgi:protein-L-isoaspartate(D-aspartate) O-methyltransferase
MCVAVLSDFAAARQRTVEEQLSATDRDIKNHLVLEAMATVPRHEFVPESLRKFAYWEEPFPIGLRSDHFPAIHSYPE